MYVCRAADGSYLQKVFPLWRYNPEAMAQPFLLSPRLDGAGQQVHSVLPRLLLINPVLYTPDARYVRWAGLLVMLSRFTVFCLAFCLSTLSCADQIQCISTGPQMLLVSRFTLLCLASCLVFHIHPPSHELFSFLIGVAVSLVALAWFRPVIARSW